MMSITTSCYLDCRKLIHWACYMTGCDDGVVDLYLSRYHANVSTNDYKMGYNQDLAVIELNGLKIAEDRTFADCARHVFASILDLCLPAPPTCKAEYQSLYQSTVPDVHAQVGSS